MLRFCFIFPPLILLGLVSVDGSSASKLPDYANLQSELASIAPSAVNSASYSPSNSAQACPTVGSDWNAATALPPTPNAELCDCMDKALTCVPSNEVTTENVGEVFGVLCGLGTGSQCDGIATNGSSGTYGAYGMCNPMQQLGWALNAYYEQQQAAGNGASACDFSGSASTQSPVAPTGTCASLVSQAGGGGTGTVTSAPTNTGSSGGGSSGSGSSGSGSSSSSSGSGISGQSTLASINFGAIQMGLYMVCAVVTGAGMILL